MVVEMEMMRIPNEMNIVGEKADPWGVPVLRVCGSE